MRVTKIKIISMVSMLVLCGCVFGLMRGSPAQAEDDQGLFIPSVDESWNNNGWVGHEQSGNSTLASTSSERSAKGASKKSARRHAASSSKDHADDAGNDSKESSRSEIICRLLPWGAGILAFSGFVMVIVSLLRRRGLFRRQIGRSPAVMQNGSSDGWVDRSPTQAVLAFRLARTDPPNPRTLPGQQKKEKKRELRRAA